MTREPPLRTLMVSSWACSLAMLAVAVLQPEVLSPEMQEAFDEFKIADLQWFGEATQTVQAVVVVALASLLLGNIAGAIGMFLYRRWGRFLSLWTTVPMQLALLPFGPEVYSGLETFFQSMSYVLWGAALAVAYWSPVAARFDRPAVTGASLASAS